MITFKLDPKSGVPVYRQIQDQIRYGIASGLLGPGEQLPTVRALAVELSVNPATVGNAYRQLEREGFLTSEEGSGTFVAAGAAARDAQTEWRPEFETLCREFLAQAARCGYSTGAVIE